MQLPFDIILNQKIIAIIIFLFTYAYITTGRKEKQIATIAGATLVWIFGIMNGLEMLSYIDFATLGLLFSMMVIVGGLRESGFFKYLGLVIADYCRYIPFRMFIMFTLATALLSALLANVTVVLFMTMIVIELSETLKINPTPFIISEIIASNIGGSATLIGDPPNILIAMETGMDFMDFIVNIAPISLATLAITIILLYYFYHDTFRREKLVGEFPLKPIEAIRDRKLFIISIVVFIGTIFLFFIHNMIGLSIASISLISAAFLLFIGGNKMPKVLDDVEWDILIFIAGLFIVIGALEKTGVIYEISLIIRQYISSNIIISISIILWLSSLLSALIANIPFTIAFIPILKDIIKINNITNSSILWWALVIGADLGGNATTIGSSSNIVALEIAKEKGYDITFKEFLKIGIIILVSTIGISNLVIIARFIFGI